MEKNENSFAPGTFPEDIQAEIDLLIEKGIIGAGETSLDDLPGNLGKRIEVHLRKTGVLLDDHELSLTVPEETVPRNPGTERLH
ncbi:MAG: hypothetical protein JW838_00815 [Spirochaetes bacterium]|nr:hypothetical protein [Spirochaetota bacterium]